MDTGNTVNTNFSILLKWLSKTGIIINIQDITGIITNNNELHLPLEFRVHACIYCEAAKSTVSGLKCCLRCKVASIKKAVKGPGIYTGKCYMGITEVVNSVFFNGKPVCLIHISNMIMKGQKEQTIERIKRIRRITGVDLNTMLSALESVKEVSEAHIAEMVEISKLVENFIIMTIESSMANARKSEDMTLINTTGKKHWVIESILKYIWLYYNKDIKLSQLANLYFMHPNYLCSLFKKETGKHFSDYINDLRIDRAKSFLNNTNDSITNISFNIGFNSVTYFNKLFKKYTGMSPNQYRKNIL